MQRRVKRKKKERDCKGSVTVQSLKSKKEYKAMETEWG